MTAWATKNCLKMVYPSAPANSFVGVFDHRSIARQILYSRLQTPYLQVNFHTIWIVGSSWVKAMIPILKKTKKNKKVIHAKDTGAGKNTGICGPKLDWEYIKFTFKTLSDPSKFLSQKNKHMRAELVKFAQSNSLDLRQLPMHPIALALARLHLGSAA